MATFNPLVLHQLEVGHAIDGFGSDEHAGTALPDHLRADLRESTPTVCRTWHRI
jgi:hypothetical protein